MAKSPKARASVSSQPLSLQEWAGLAMILFFLSVFIYYVYRRCTASSRKYKQTNPYVATVDLHERYGGLEKRAVSISDLSTEQLALLRRDGKLTTATIEKLVREGRLPKDENQDIASFISKKKSASLGSNAGYSFSSASSSSTSTEGKTATPSSSAEGASTPALSSDLKQPVKQRKGKSGKGKKK